MNLHDMNRSGANSGDKIAAVLDRLARHHHPQWTGDFREIISTGVAFTTFAYDIDGVSMEVMKYATCLEALLPGAPIHCIAGTFGDKADMVLEPSWQRFELTGADGWDKWDGGKWFTRMFYEDLPAGGARSMELADEIWRQALSLANRLVEYIESHQIKLIFNVNVNSNPGNVAFALAVVLASESTGCVVINNNHDFYWEGGKAGCKRNPGELPGPRDHFFRNHDNEEFFGFFQRIYPWNGRRWVQVNINARQSRRLIDRYHFRPDLVYSIGTGIDPEFFRGSSPTMKRELRRRMSHVLGGAGPIRPMSISEFTANVTEWMTDQQPVVCGRDGSERTLDVTADGALYLLQPTRVVARKRIWRDWDLIGALLNHAPFRAEFDRRPEVTLTLHVTGPVPVEHQLCLEHVLASYLAALDAVPTEIADRLFLALSAGCQSHPTLDDDVGMVDIYQLADLVLFPSLTEGRGLPIAEASAAGVPIVCSEYQPLAVFSEVVGHHLDPEHRIVYDKFPDAQFSDELLDHITAILFEPSTATEHIEHNRAAVKGRFALEVLQSSLDEILDRLALAVREI